MPDVICQVSSKPSGVEFIWSSRGGFFPPYLVDGRLPKLLSYAEKARDALKDLVEELHRMGDPQAQHDLSYQLAEAGHRLFQEIIPLGNKTAADVGRWLTELRSQGGLIGLEIVLDRSGNLRLPLSIPWNLVYDERPGEHKAEFESGQGSEQWLPFWSVRYNLTSGRRVEPLRRLPVWRDPRVIVVVDPSVHQEMHEGQRRRLDAFLAEAGIPMVGSKAELEEALAGGRPRLLYWMGHATSSYLRLGDEDLTPDDLRSLFYDSPRPREQPEGMLAFLNACQTAEASESEGSFLDVLDEVGFAGAIVTEQQTIDNFANEFGLDFLQGFLREGEPLGELLHKLRFKKAPLGLLYGAHCPPEITVRYGSAPEATALPEKRDAVDVSGVLLKASAADRALAPVPAARVGLPERPYPSLAYYDEADRLLFTGREADVVRFCATLDLPDTRILVLHGESGLGKSSFLRAGVIPYLEEECVGYRFLRGPDRRRVIVQVSKDPVGRLAQALLDMTASPLEYVTPTGDPLTIDLRPVIDDALAAPAGLTRLREALMTDARLLADLLARIADRLPHSLVLVVDQTEELFTLARTDQEIVWRDQALRLLQRVADSHADVKVILAARTEYYGRLLDHLRAGRRDLFGVRDDLLRDISEDALVEVIERPTLEATLSEGRASPRAAYRFRYADDVARAIARGVRGIRSENQDSALPLVQALCTRLYERLPVDPESAREITLSDLGDLRQDRADLGRDAWVKGALRAFVEDAMERSMGLGPADREAFQALYISLYARQSDGTLTTWLKSGEALESEWTGERPFGEVLEAARAERLLRIDKLRVAGDRPAVYVRLGHDALAEVAESWKSEREQRDRLREEETRRRKLFGGLVAVSLLAAVFALGGITFWRQKREAEALHRESQMMSAELALDKGITFCEADQLEVGMLWLARSLKLAPRDAPDLRWVIRANLATWQRQCHVLKGVMRHDATVRAVAFSADGKYALTGSYDGSARLWDVDRGTLRRSFDLQKQVYCVAFSPDGATFALGGEGGAVSLMDMRTLELTRTIEVPHKGSHPVHVHALEFSPDGKRLATGDSANTARIWDIRTGLPIGDAMPHPDAVVAVDFGADAILTGCWDGTARLWETDSRPRNTPGIAHQRPIRTVAISPDGKSCLTGCMEGVIRRWDLATGKLEHEYGHHYAGVISLAFSTDGRTFASGGLDSTVRVVDVASGTPLGHPIHHLAWVTAVAFHPDGERILTGSGDNTARLSRALIEPEETIALAHPNMVRSARFSPDGKTIVTACEDARVRLWDAGSGVLKKEFKAHDGAVTEAIFSPDGNSLLTASLDRTARLWTVNGFKRLYEFKHDELVQSIMFDRDGGRIVTGSYDRKVRIWDATTGGLMPPPLVHRSWVQSAVFSPGDRFILTGDFDGMAQVWDASTRKPIGASMKHPGSIYAAAFNPDGERAVTAGESSASLWDLRSRAKVSTLPHSAPVWSVAYSPDGRVVMTGDGGGRARFWDPRTGRPIGKSYEHGNVVRSIAFSRDGERFATASWDGKARIHFVPRFTADEVGDFATWVQSLTGFALDESGNAKSSCVRDWK